MRDINIRKFLIFLGLSVIFAVVIVVLLLWTPVGKFPPTVLFLAMMCVMILFSAVLYFVFSWVDRRLLGDLRKTLEKIRDGDLQVDSLPYGGANVIGLRKSLDGFVGNLSETLRKIEFSVLDINGNASTLSMFSDNISERVKDEKENITKITGAMTELKNIADSIKSYASDAQTLSKNNREKITYSAQTIKNLIGAMNEISDASSSIVEIAKYIEEVADETNLLALNASIEASRAGAEGAGFSIVASEIRSLAENSTSAIKNITDTVEKIVRSVSKGVEFSTSAKDALDSIITGITEISSKIEDIAGKISNQTFVTNEIYNEVEAVNRLVNQNVEVLTEMLSAVTNLSRQSNILKDISGGFMKGRGEDISTHIYGVVMSGQEPAADGAPLQGSDPSSDEVKLTLKE